MKAEALRKNKHRCFLDDRIAERPGDVSTCLANSSVEWYDYMYNTNTLITKNLI